MKATRAIPGTTTKLYRRNLKLAREKWSGTEEPFATSMLKSLSAQFGLEIADGDLVFLNDRWYVSHSGLLHIARRRRCFGISCEPVASLCDKDAGRYVFRAVVYTSKNSGGFVGFGDADRSNVSALVHGAEIRVAETRAVNRALRKAYGIGLCSVEEIGTTQPSYEKLTPQNTNGYSAGPKVRDRLCQIIRQHQLDPELVKAYAVDFCGAKTLREATREQLENFVQELAEWAVKDRNALLCQLNSYMRPAKEVVA